MPKYLPDRMPAHARESVRVYEIECQDILVFFNGTKYVGVHVRAHTRTEVSHMSQHMSDFTAGKCQSTSQPGRQNTVQNISRPL